MPIKLTDPDPKLTELRNQTPPGMAHWGGTGPTNMKCRHCVFWDFQGQRYANTGELQPARCRRYTQLTNELGKKVPHHAKACRHFKPAETVPQIVEQPKWTSQA